MPFLPVGAQKRGAKRTITVRFWNFLLLPSRLSGICHDAETKIPAQTPAIMASILGVSHNGPCKTAKCFSGLKIAVAYSLTYWRKST